MMQRVTLLTGLMWLLATAALSQEVCTIAASLERVQFAQMRMQNSPDFNGAPGDRSMHIRETSTLDLFAIQQATSLPLGDARAVQLVEFARQSKKLTSFIRTNNAAEIARFFGQADYLRLRRQVAKALPALACTPPVQGTVQNGDGASNAQVTNNRRARSFTIENAILGLALSVLALIGLYFGQAKYRERKKLRKRRAARYPTRIATLMRTGTAPIHILIHDISCNGAKISTSADSTIDPGNDTVEIWIFEKWHIGKIAWQNKFYMGVNFAQPLAIEDVRTKRHIDPLVQVSDFGTKKAAPV